MGKIQFLRMLVVCILLLSCIMPFLFVENSKAVGNKIYVNVASQYSESDGSADRPYQTIQEAIDISEDGDELYIFPGTYNETLTIDKKISIIGLERDNTIIDHDGENHRYLVKITSDLVILENLTFSDKNNFNSQALVYVESDQVSIQSNNFTNSTTWGLYLSYCDGTTVGNNIFYDVKGSYLMGSNNNVFSNNNFTLCSNAGVFSISSSGEGIIYNNTFEKCKYGIYFQNPSSNNNISYNRINGSTISGIKFSGGTNNSITYNYINDSGVDGINLNAINSNVIENKFRDNQISVNIIKSSCVVRNNIINDSKSFGIFASSSSSNNKIFINHFNRNVVNAKDLGENNWDHNNKGNFWDDYNEVDENLDKIGDEPYKVSTGSYDNYPLGIFLKPPDRPNNPSPSDESENVGLSVTLKVKVVDNDSTDVDVYFYKASDDSLLGIDYNVLNNTNATYSFTLPFETTFLWYAVATDGKLENQSDIWIFTTQQIPPKNQKPVADPGGPYVDITGETISLDGSGSNDPDGTIDFYRWNFGDGSSEIIDVSPTHEYTDAGTYTITLTVVDNDGRSDTEFTTATITSVQVKNIEPVAVIESSYNNIKIGNSIEFDASNSYDNDGEIMLYEWDLNNDGEYEQSSTSAKTTNEFSTKGSYQIWLRVTDDDGLTDTETFIITVEDSKEGIPGFEFILAVLSIIVTIIYSKRKK